MKKLFFIFATLVMSITVQAAKEVYTEFDAATGTLTYYYDDQRASRSGITEVYDPVYSPNAVRFKEYDTQVTKAVIDPSMKDAHLSSTYKMFYGGYDQKSYKLSNMTEIVGMENLVTDEVWSMSCMFQFCTKLTTIDLSHLNTANVTNMWGMFYLCWGLTSLDLSLFQTANVRDMGYMFSNCDALTSLDLTSFNISEVTSMESMFAYNSALTTITCNNDWSKSTTLTNSANMFNGCTSLKGGKGTACDGENYIDKSYARPDGANGMPGYFTAKEGQGDDPGDCTSEGVELYTEFDATTGTLTFYYDDQRCSREGLTEIYEQGAQHYESYHNQVLKAVIDPSMQNAHLTSTAYMFFGGWGETNLTLSAMTEIEGIENLVTDNVTDMHGMFDYCSALLSLDLRSFNTANVTDMSFMFSGCSALRSLDISTFNTARVTNMSGMFESCSALASLDLSSFNTSNVTNMSSMFSQSGLTMLDLSSFNTAKVTSMSGMFYACDELVSLNVSSFNTAKVKSMRQMFLQCRFTSIDLSSFNTAAVTDMKGMFSQCLYLRSLDLNNFNTANVTNMNCMFEHCYYLTLLDIRSFDIGKVTDMSGMFDDDKRLTTIWCAGDWSKSTALTNSANMFRGCIALEGDQGTKCDGVNYIDKTYARPDEVDIAGYFTAERLLGDPEVYTEFKDGVLTYYYDNQRSKRTGITEPYNPDDDVAAIRFREYREQITKAVIHESMKDAHLTSTYRMFFGGLEEYYGEQRSYPLSALTQIEGMENLVTDEVRSMEWMFNGCSALTSLDVTHLNTARVTSFGRMFNGCSALTELDINSFNIDNASYLYSMFEGCSSLRTIYCNHNWSISTASAVTMFKGCTSLVGGQGTACDGVNAIDKTYARPDYGEAYPGYFTGKYPTELYTAYKDGTLTYYYDDLRTIREGVTEVYDPVNDPSAKRFVAYHDDVTKVIIDPSMQKAGLTSTYRMFYGGFTRLNNGEVKHYNLSALTEIEGMENLVTDNVTNMQEMFNRCLSLTSIDLSHLKTAKVTNMNSMFIYCTALTMLDLNPFQVSNVTDIRNMFSYCAQLKTILCDNNWYTSAALAYQGSVFTGCTSLVGGKGTQYDAEKEDETYARPDKGSRQPGYFSKQETEVYTSFNETIGVLTYYYDDQRFFREGINELYDPNAMRFVEYHDKVTKAVIDPSMKNAGLTSTRSMFYGGYLSQNEEYASLSKMTEIEGMKNLVTDNVTDMSYMFSYCQSLTSLNLSSFDTHNVTNMSCMFYECWHLETPDFSSFDTRNVENLSYMFKGCYAFTSLDLSSFNTSKVTTMGGLFYWCNSLTSVNLSSFNTANVTDMSSMFSGCSSLTSLDLSNFNTAKVTSMSYMFSDCPSLTSLNLSSFDTRNVTYMNVMFYRCTGLTILDINHFNIALVTNMKEMFSCCIALQTILCNEDWSKSSALTKSDQMFTGCTSLVGGKGTTYDANHVNKEYAHPDGGSSNQGYFTAKPEVYASFNNTTDILTYYYDDKRYEREVAGESTKRYDPENNDYYSSDIYVYAITKAVIDASMQNAGLTSTKEMFCEFSQMTEIEGMQNLVTDNVTDMTEMFRGCSKLTSIDLSHLKTDKVKNMSRMFYDCQALTSLDLFSFNTGEVTDMFGMFKNCISLTSLDLNSFNIDKVTDMSQMFEGCRALTTIWCNEYWSKSKVIGDWAEMFGRCYSLVGGQGTTYDSDGAIDYAHPDGGKSDPGYFTVAPTEVYTAFNETTGVLTYYYDDQRAAHRAAGEITEPYDPVNDPYATRFSGYADKVTKTVINESMQNAGLTSASKMFTYLSAMTEIEGLSNLVTDNVTNMYSMFSDCESLTSLNLSHFNTGNVTDMNHMFDHCKSLTSLDVSSFNTSNVTDMTGMFEFCKSLTSLDLSRFDTHKVTYMGDMFHGCNALTSLNVSSFNTSNVTNMFQMFNGCTSLTSLDLNNFITDNVTNMDGLFGSCEALTSLDLSRFDTHKVTYMGDMFHGCYALTSLNVSSFNTSNVTNMSQMFDGCTSLTSLDLNNFITDNVTNMEGLFGRCYALSSIDLSSFNIAKVENMQHMFYMCSALKTILCNEDWSKISQSEYMFKGCTSLVGGMGTTYDENHVDAAYARPDGENGLPGYFTEKKKEVYTEFDATSGTLTYYYDDQRDSRKGITALYEPEKNPNAVRFKDYYDQVYKVKIDASMKNAHLTSMSTMFSSGDDIYRLNKLLEISGMENLVTDEVTDMSWMFYGCSRLTSLDVSRFNTANVTNMKGMFYRCEALKSLDVSKFNTANVTNMSSMFYVCSSLTSLDVSHFNTANVTKMSNMFASCSKLTSIDLSSFNTENVTDMSSMFSYCSRLSSLDVSHFNTANVTNMHVMFYRCASLTSLDLSKFDTKNVTGMDYMFEGCTSLTSLDISKFNTAKVKDMRAMFKNCTKITSLNLSSFNTKNVQYMQEMFMDCSLLASIDFGSFNTTNVSYMTDMFSGCKSLVTLDLTSFNAVKKANRSSMFMNCSSLTTILCNEDFSQHNYSSYGMFSGCTSLVGGKGTKCDGVNNIDEEYARPDEGSSKPGYFTGDIKQSSLQSIPTNGPSTFDFSLFDPAGSELLGITLGSWDWYNWGEGRMEISTTNTEEEIDEKLNAAFAGAASLKSLLPGTITFKLEAGQGEIEIDCKTVPGYTLKVRIAEYGTAYISSTIEQATRGKATVTYDVKWQTYVVIYLDGSNVSPKAPARIAKDGDDDPEEVGAYIYAITVTPKEIINDIDNLIFESSNAQIFKFVKDGQIFILRGDRIYTVDGRLVK